MRANAWRLGCVFMICAVAGCGGSKDGGQGGAGGGSAMSAGGGSVNGGGGSDNGPCTAGQSRACYEGPAATLGVGICKAGTHTCKADGSGFGACEGQVLPKQEDCSTPEDEDCDGEVNQASACSCKPGDQKACYDGPDGTEGVGLCKSGMKTCADDGKSWGACDGQVLPMPEDCNSRGDENCDGVACSDAIWDRVAGDAADQRVSAVAIDDTGNTYVVGSYGGTTDLGTGPMATTFRNAFLAKYDPTGAALWVDSFVLTGNPNSGVRSVAVSAAGDVVISGYATSGTITLGSKVVDGTSGGGAGFVAVYDAQGKQTWLRRLTSTLGAQGLDAKFDASGNVFVSGSFAGTMACGTDPCPTSSSNNAVDPFVREFDGGGTEQWTHHYPAAGGASADHLAVRSDGHILVCGMFAESITLMGTTHTAVANAEEIFVVEAGPTGGGNWAFVLQGGGYSFASVAVRPDDSFFLAGTSGAPLSAGSLSTGGPSDGASFMFSFDKSGAPQWAKTFDVGSRASRINDAATDGQGNFVITGELFENGTVDFGGGQRSPPRTGTRRRRVRREVHGRRQLPVVEGLRRRQIAGGGRRRAEQLRDAPR